jgi:hypothetical protein
MNVRKLIAARHDRGKLLRYRSSASNIAWFVISRRKLSNWFGLLHLAARQSGRGLVDHGLLGAWRCQPIPVVNSTGYPATNHLGCWSRFVRI